ncbi:MAG: isoprenylcysteine carboxylmethyltransferase family protein [Elusimicrobia bacterium]|nr:isoprenylcysteine carboxylmethyltransferase family protein [Elusimicrobiota bacterium]
MKKRILVSQIIGAAAVLIARPNNWKLFSAGICFMLLGAAIRALASSAIVKSRTLTIAGPYAAVRNPLYLGTASMVLGLLVSLSNPQAPLRTGAVWLITAVSFTLIYRVQIKAEEEFLLSVYGEEFERYRSRVNAILPRPADIAGFFDRTAYSWEIFRKNKEWRGFLGMSAIAAVVAARIKYGF